MKYVQSITFRALSAICIGCLLVAFPEDTNRWLVIIIGCLFLLPGLISLVAYFRLRNSSESMRPLFPLVGVGSLLFGGILIAFSKAFVEYMIYVLAAFLVLAGISQIVNMMKIKKLVSVGKLFFILPLIITLAGLFVFVDFSQTQALPYTIVSLDLMIYGVLELIIAIHFRKVRRMMYQEATKQADASTPDAPEKAIESTNGEVDLHGEGDTKPTEDQNIKSVAPASQPELKQSNEPKLKPSEESSDKSQNENSGTIIKF